MRLRRLRYDKRAGLKPPAQYMEAHWADTSESNLFDFHELRQGFSPTDKRKEFLYDLLETPLSHHLGYT
jgi:hypothetical protein